MTLATFNHYVDNATDAKGITPWYGRHGALVVGDRVLYWQEDLKKIRKPFKAKGRHRKEKMSMTRFFRQSFPIPRKHSLFHKWFRLFRGW